MTNSEASSPGRARVVSLVVATTVMLSFISFSKAAAVVLSDLASSAYYAGGIAETAIGSLPDWFILSITCAAQRGPCDLTSRAAGVLRPGRGCIQVVH